MTCRYPGRVLRTKALRSSSLRLLNDRDREDVFALCDQDPVVNVFVTSRVHEAGLDPVRLGGQMWGFVPGGRLPSLGSAGANLVPVAATPDAIAAFGGRARLQGRRCSSIVGPADAIRDLWDLLRPYWGQPREIRRAQPVMAISGPPRVAADPLVRRGRPAALSVLMPASVALFTQEVGGSPAGPDGGSAYRARVGELIAAGRGLAPTPAGHGLVDAADGRG